MRACLLFVLIALTLLCACPKPGGGGGAADQAWKPDAGMPPEWPIKQLALPSGATVFEGHVDTQDGSTVVTVFYTSTSDWESQLRQIEASLGKLKYLRMPPGSAEGASGQHQTWVSPSGELVVLLLYEEDAQAAARLGRPGFYTLMTRQLKDALAVDPAWEAIR
jgi:hypothetical protein